MWFGEAIPTDAMERTSEFMQRAGKHLVFLAVGTSGAVYPAAGFVDVWTNFPDAHWGNARHFVCGARGVSEWTFTGTRTDGTRVEVQGCDLFIFRHGKIALKNSFRKNRPPVTHGTTGR